LRRRADTPVSCSVLAQPRKPIILTPQFWASLPGPAVPFVSEEPSSICSPRISPYPFPASKTPSRLFVCQQASVFVRVRDFVAPTSVYSRETGVPCCSTRSAGLLGRKSGCRFDKSSNHIAGYLVRTTPRWRTTTMCMPASAQTSRPRQILRAERFCSSTFGHSPVCSESIHSREARKQAIARSYANGAIRVRTLQVPKPV
jgi:hypothetical protein